MLRPTARLHVYLYHGNFAHYLRTLSSSHLHVRWLDNELLRNTIKLHLLLYPNPSMVPKVLHTFNKKSTELNRLVWDYFKKTVLTHTQRTPWVKPTSTLWPRWPRGSCQGTELHLIMLICELCPVTQSTRDCCENSCSKISCSVLSTGLLYS